MLLPLTLSAWSWDNEHFMANTPEGVPIFYSVMSEENKTCMVTTIDSNYKDYNGTITIPSIVGGITNWGMASHPDGFYSEYTVIWLGAAFHSCTGLTSVNLPASLTRIGQSFSGCTSLSSITIPSSVTEIDCYAFKGCTSLTSVTIPSGVTTIEQSTFSGCTALTSVSLPSGLTSIEGLAFEDCTSLTTINIPSGVTSLGSQAFKGCTSLTSIDIPTSVNTFGDAVFNGCTNLVNVSLPPVLSNTNTWNGKNIFYDCTSLPVVDNIRYAGSWAIEVVDKKQESYTVKEGTTYLDEQLFHDYHAQPSGHEFENLKSISLPSTLKAIGRDAFYWSEITSITIPAGVTSIDAYAFENCFHLTSVISEVEEPFTFGENAFSNISSDCILTVPLGKRDAYIAAGWTEVVFGGGIYEKATFTAKSYSIQYGSAIPALGYNVTGGPALGTPQLSTTATSASPVGTYPITISKGTVSNYGPTFVNGTLTITKAPLTITASSYTIEQGQPLPSFAVSYSGFKNGQTNAVLSKQPSITCSATSSSAPGTYDIIVSGATAGNYEISYVKGTLTITRPTHIELADGQTYSIAEDMDMEQITYSRTYKNTNWQAWYVPFEVELTSDLLSRFSFAKYAGTYVDENSDPSFFITIARLKAGDKLKANTPYFVQAKTASNTAQVISVANTTLKAAEETGFDMYSAEQKVSIRGVYSAKTATASDCDWYAYGGGSYFKATAGAVLNPYRVYLTITEREDNPYGTSSAPNEIKVKLLGDDGTTIIEEVQGVQEVQDAQIFDLSGRRIMKDKLDKGIYIINGKKVLVR